MKTFFKTVGVEPVHLGGGRWRFDGAQPKAQLATAETPDAREGAEPSGHERSFPSSSAGSAVADGTSSSGGNDGKSPSKGSSTKTQKQSSKDDGPVAELPGATTSMMRAIWEPYLVRYSKMRDAEQKRNDAAGASVGDRASVDAGALAAVDGVAGTQPSWSLPRTGRTEVLPDGTSLTLYERAEWGAGAADGRNVVLRNRMVVRLLEEPPQTGPRGAASRPRPAAAGGSDDTPPVYAMVQAIFREGGGREAEPRVQFRRMLRGVDTVLRDAAHPLELFVLDSSERPGGGHLLPEPGEKGASARLEGLFSLPLSGPLVAEVLDAEFIGGRKSRQRESQAAAARARYDVGRQVCGLPPAYVYRHAYCPRQGCFRELQPTELDGHVQPHVPPKPSAPLPDGRGFVKDGNVYQLGDFLLLSPGALGQQRPGWLGGVVGPADDASDAENAAGTDVEAETETSEDADGDAEAATDASKATPPRKGKGTRIVAPREPWLVGQLVAVRVEEVKSQSASMARSKASAVKVPAFKLKVRLLARPDEVLKAAQAELERRFSFDYADLLAPIGWEAADPAATDCNDDGWLRTVSADDVYGSCTVRLRDSCDAQGRVGAAVSGPSFAAGPALPPNGGVSYRVVGSFDPSCPARELGPPPASLALGGVPPAEAVSRQLRTADRAASASRTPACAPLRTLDVFAGAGGLSSGLAQTGAFKPEWAVEMNQDASQAYAINHPGANVFSLDCNVALKAAMDRDSLEGSDCVATPECVAAAAGLDPRLVAGLPRPGEVEAIVGGPPCPGFSIANQGRGNKKSMQTNMLMISYLSLCDYYRPQVFIMENVMGFRMPFRAEAPKCEANFFFRLAIRSLLDMGYQVRFGALSAAHHGLPQKRERVFIIATQPGTPLPDWPAPRHALSRPPPGIRVPGGMYYATAPQRGAPYRMLTIWDAIGDLPEIENCAS
ncbi:hypothetical protein GPECTOR_10g769 [Gonium pectorale]|uniref:DNA (cytosine-5-)-methyltransferase n=1 Tax=Gonium pectorale TaxID=33097 RepID=A0A150GS47_GONPE|nr:hypothetical protein GPECTOR_10g769 [Gonium pectorale]|eukprot:KXZ52140.1 hypothetical protein GPECTOR_10g769 [Gonium pectorale]